MKRINLIAGDWLNTVLARGQTRLAYTVYGGLREVDRAQSLPGFTGQPQDVGHYLLGSYRLFNVALGRFCSPDSNSPFGAGGLNGYCYCQGDPINAIDPTGRVKQVRFSPHVSTAIVDIDGPETTIMEWTARVNEHPEQTTPLLQTRYKKAQKSALARLGAQETPMPDPPSTEKLRAVTKSGQSDISTHLSERSDGWQFEVTSSGDDAIHLSPAQARNNAASRRRLDLKAHEMTRPETPIDRRETLFVQVTSAVMKQIRN